MLQSTDKNEIIGTIYNLNTNVSAGYVDIPTLLTKGSKFIIARSLTNLFNNFLEKDII